SLPILSPHPPPNLFPYTTLFRSSNQPQKPVIVDLLRQDPDHDIMVQGPVAVGDVSLDEPYGPGPGALDLPQRGMTSTPFPEPVRSEEHTSELQSRFDLVCRLLLE